MGNTLNKTPTSPYKKALISQLRNRNLSDLIDCYNVLSEDYTGCTTIDFSQFEDIFGPMLDDAEPFFLELQNDHDIDGTVDVYETIAAFTVFIKEQFEKKVMFIFQLFDFDQTSSLESSELAITLQSAARGLCKFVHIPVPSAKSLELEAKNIFIKIDLDNNKKITHDEFMAWLRGNNELQDFLLKHVGIQTFDNMKKRADAIHSMFLHHFIRASGARKGESADQTLLREYIEEDKRLNLSGADTDFLFDVLKTMSSSFAAGANQEETGFLSRKAFEHVMKAWCAFSASDINGDNSISSNELHAMMWIYEGEEPNESRVKSEMKVIDKDGSGEIDRYEWMKHHCLTDQNGKDAVKKNLKVLFKRHDSDNSGHLSLDEIKELVREAFRDYMKRTSDPVKKKTVEDMIDNLTKQIFRELDDDNSTNIGWEEFKRYMDVAEAKIQKLKEFLDSHL